MIRRLLKKLACKHKWEVHYEHMHYCTGLYLDGEPVKMLVKHEQTMICVQCGKIKKILL